MTFTVPSLIAILFLFTLGGGLLHAWYNKRKTHELKEKGENPYEIPKVYQKHTSPKDAGIGA